MLGNANFSALVRPMGQFAVSKPAQTGFGRDNLASTQLAKAAEALEREEQAWMLSLMKKTATETSKQKTLQNATPQTLEPGKHIAASNTKTSLPDLEKHYAALNQEISGLVGKRIHLAQIALSLGLPDHAISFMQKAYGDIRFLLEGLISDLAGREPTGKLRQVLGHLKMLKEKVMSQLRLTISSFGGPMLSPEETEALLAKDSDFDENKDPVAKKILQDFNLIKTKDDLKKHTFTAMDKIVKALPNILGGVASDLQQLRADPNAGLGSAVINVNQALTRLGMAKGLLSLAIGGENAFKEQAVPAANLARFEGVIDQLTTLAEETFSQLENRGFVLSRNTEDPLGATKDPVLAEAMQARQERKEVQKPQSPQENAGLPLQRSLSPERVGSTPSPRGRIEARQMPQSGQIGLGAATPQATSFSISS